MSSWVDGGPPEPMADGPAAETTGRDAAIADEGGRAERPQDVGGFVMSDADHGPFGVWGSAGPSVARWRPRLRGVLAVVGVAVGLLATAWVVGRPDGEPAGVRWADPDSVATAFVERYSVHDPAVCELVTSALRSRLDGEGRCAGPIRGASPRIAVLGSQTCGDVHSFDALVAPEGELGKRFVAVGLERTQGTAWLVRSVLPIGDCRVLATPSCGSGG